MSAALTQLAGGMSGDDEDDQLLGGPDPGEAHPAADDHGEQEGQPAGPDMDAADVLHGWISSKNIADELGDDEIGEIASRVKREYELDEESRADWLQKYRQWLDFAMQITTPKTYPWAGASNIIYPLLTTAAVQFAARAYPGVVRDRDVVRGTVVGEDDGVPAPNPQQQGQPLTGPDGKPIWMVPPGAKRARADNIGKHMSWQILEEMEDWEEQTDKLLLVLSIVGTMFRKTYFDPVLGRNVSETVDCMRLCVNYNAKSFATAPRHTELIDYYPWEIEEKIRSGLFLDDDYGRNHDMGQDEDAPTTFLEQHRRWDLDGDGYDEPYIITIARDSGRLARIVTGYDHDGVMYSPTSHKIVKVDPVAYYTKYSFIPSPDSAVYDLGFGNLLFPLNESINTSLNQMFDAGHLANAGGGFMGSGMSMNAGSVRFQVGEYKVVNTNGSQLRENLVPLNFPGPNGVLFELLQFLVEAGKDIASIKDVLSGAMPGGNTPGILGLAVIQQGLKVFSAIFKRVHRSLAKEYKKLYRLNRLYLPDETGYQVGEAYFKISRKDYEKGSGVVPVSDPETVTDLQQMARANFLLQFKDDPHCDGQEIRRRVFEAAGIGDVNKIFVDQLPLNPEVIFKQTELQLRAQRESRDLDIRQTRDKATEIRELSQAILNLALARKADAEVDQGWVDVQISNLKAQLDGLTAPTQSPAQGTGAGGSAPVPAGPPGGPGGSGIPDMAPSPGQQSGAGLPAGSPGGA